MTAKERIGKNILVIEDDGATRDALALFLRGEGYTVAVVKNGQEGLDHLRHTPPPDLILLDLLMPTMDGYTFREEQQRDPALACIPVVVLSAAGVVAAQGDLLGDVGYLQKPVDADLLLSAIHRFTVPAKPVVLIVEDEEAVAIMLDVALRHYGFAVRLALTGKEAVELYRQHYGNIALTLSDVQMPDMDGPATIAALKKINPNLAFCFMSGSTGKYSTKELLEMGAAHVLMKPFVSLSLFTRLLWDMVATSQCGT